MTDHTPGNFYPFAILHLTLKYFFGQIMGFRFFFNLTILKKKNEKKTCISFSLGFVVLVFVLVLVVSVLELVVLVLVLVLVVMVIVLFIHV